MPKTGGIMVAIMQSGNVPFKNIHAQHLKGRLGIQIESIRTRRLGSCDG
jgi:hypothetical protein